MADPRWRRVWTLFHDALDRDASSRPAFLDTACEGDLTLREEVVALLAAHDSDPAFLETPPLAGAAGPPHGLEGRRIGPYVIRRVLGEGGMGIVCDAEQEGDVQRRVALKLVRPGMETRELVARFADERRALALMNHPNIATAFDVGVTDEGRPYFAMEFVDGRPITEWCDARRLTLRERLELFLQVCDAVQHAHQKGIIHRDLKPSNVLVEIRDGRPVPKVIDFGVAKVMERRASDAAFRTHVGQVIGTPEYMSPEQAGAVALDVDTRSDIYSLGVLLFELLVGALPVDLSALRAARFAEFERVLFAHDPPRPSQRFGGLGEAGERAAANRGTRTATLLRGLKGDLDWIVLKAMERDRARRYASVSELATDISRYLADEPVTAGPPTAAYRVRKFVSRHRGAVAVAAALVLVTAGFVATTLVQAERTRQALATAEAERARAEQVAAFLVDLFEVSDPGEVRGNSITAREVLDQGAARISASLETQPDVRAGVMDTIGTVFRNLGLYERADALLGEALALRRQVFGDDPRVADTLTQLATTNRARGRFAEALAQHREALAIRERRLGPDHLDVAESLNNVCAGLNSLGQRAEAQRACEQAMAIKTRHHGPDGLALVPTLQNLGQAHELDGDFAAAEAVMRRALEIRLRHHGEGHLETARAQNLLGAILYRRGDIAGAGTLYCAALATYRAVLDPTHPTVTTALNNLAVVQRLQGELADADRSFRDVIAARRARLGDGHSEVAVGLNNLAFVLRDRGDLAGAAALFREALDILRAAVGPDHVNYANVQGNLAEILAEQGDASAEALAREALQKKLQVLPRDHQAVAVSLSLVGHLQAERGDATGAEPVLREALATLLTTLPDTHERVVQVQARLAAALARSSR